MQMYVFVYTIYYIGKGEVYVNIWPSLAGAHNSNSHGLIKPTKVRSVQITKQIVKYTQSVIRIKLIKPMAMCSDIWKELYYIIFLRIHLLLNR